MKTGGSMQQEYELIEHSILKNVKVFLVNLDYRTPHIHGDMEIRAPG